MMEQTIKPGIYKDISNADYHSGAGISKSDLDIIHKSPALWKYRQDHPQADAPSPALEFGLAFHALVLEPELFAAEYDIAKPIDRRTKAGRAAAEELKSSGKKFLAPEVWGAIHGMRDSLMSNPIAAALISESVHEVSMYANIDDVLCKCRPDIWCEKRLIIADLKSTQDASPREFSRSVANFRYYVQAAWYSEIAGMATGTTPREFVFLAVEKKPPYLVGVYILDPEAKVRGWAEAKEDLLVYSTCVWEDEWNGYDPGIVELRLPKWF